MSDIPEEVLDRAMMKLSAARMTIVRKLPMLAATLLPITYVFSMEVPAEGRSTENGVVGLNPVLTSAMDAQALAGLIFHHVLHISLRHGQRRRLLNVPEEGSERWNMATEASTNEIVRDIGLQLPTELAHTNFFPETIFQPPNLSVEDRYYRLQANPPPPPQTGGGGQGEGVESSHGSAQTGEADELDKKLDQIAASKGLDRGEGSRATLEHDMAKGLSEAYTGKEAGSTPAWLKLWADSILQPKRVPWDQLLLTQVRRAIDTAEGHSDYTFREPSPLQPIVGYGVGHPVLPGLYATRARIAVVEDTSGSMTGGDEHRLALGTIESILRSTKNPIVYFSCDAATGEMTEVKRLGETAKVRTGGGGTDFEPILEKIEGMPDKKRPDILVIVTDGVGPVRGVPPNYPVIWAIIGGGHKPCTWGVEVQITASGTVTKT